MIKRTLAIVSCILLLTTIVTGCGSNKLENSDIGNSKTIKIGFSLPAKDETNLNMQSSYKKVAEKLENVELIFSNAAGDDKQQIEDVKSLIEQNCDIIIMRPINGTKVSGACDAAAKANIPVIIDQFTVSTKNYAVFTPIDQADHGRVLGTYIQDLLDKGEMKEAKIGYIIGDSDEYMIPRMTGIKDTCSSAIIVVEGTANNWSATEAQNVVENWISSGKISDINIIACMDDALANAAITALGDDYPDMIVLGAGGENVQAGNNMASGKLKASTYRNNVDTAEMMLGMCVDLANGIEPKYDNPENRLFYLHSISLMTTETLSNR